MRPLRIVGQALAVIWAVGSVLFLAVEVWWFGLGIAVVVATLVVLARRRAARGEGSGANEGIQASGTDAEGVWALSGETKASVRWEDLCEIGIVTTDEGPYVEDVFWIFRARNGAGCALPGSLGAQILDRISGLPGVDYQAVIAASGSAENASFVVWQGEPGAAARCGATGDARQRQSSRT